MIRLLATLGSAALVIWGVDLALDTGSWREPAARVSEGVADALDAVTETAKLAARPHRSESPTPDAVQAGEPGIAVREEFEPDLDPEPASASGLRRVRAEEIRSRLDRVMDLARGPSP